ncbi:MAG: RNA polymerase sigma-54 factor [Phycisphaerales bacterium]|nr:RNA polymerase sigma-54 factor [Phycisphaerales bacterium]
MRMELSQQAQNRLSQQLKLAPRVLQSMEILQMPLQSLIERIDQELESNVALEQVEPEPEEETDDGEAPASSGPSETPVGERLARAEVIHDRSDDDNLSESWRERVRLDGEPDAKSFLLANLPSRGESLESILLGQWALCEAPEDIMAAGRLILRSVGENGLLVKGLDAIALEGATEAHAPGRSSPTLATLEEALARLQGHLEPTGLAARTLTECLLLQLAAKSLAEAPRSDDTRFLDARTLIEQDLHELELGKYLAIERKRGWSTQRLDAARETLRHLDPAPGRSLAVEAEPAIRPDVIIDYDAETDVYSARLASGFTPNLRVSEEYARLAKSARVDAATKELLATGIRRAKWFIDAIEQRGATLLRVVNEVIVRQHEWLGAGSGALKPLPMTRVAKELRMNVSTVSRAVAGKWLITPRGSYELRRLFSGGTETDSGTDISWEAVRAMVREIVDGERKESPLSDQSIVAVLKGRGVTLARRTVVKYREQLGIRASRLRKVRPPS